MADYIAALIAHLDTADPAAAARLRQVVGLRRARISLDTETVDVWFDSGAFMVEEVSIENGAAALDGQGRTDRRTTLDLLDGYAEVTDAVLDGRLDLVGTVDDVARIFQAIAILLDGATRWPPLQRLAEAYRADPCLHVTLGPRPTRLRTGFVGDPVSTEELALLERLDLLP